MRPCVLVAAVAAAPLCGVDAFTAPRVRPATALRRPCAGRACRMVMTPAPPTELAPPASAEVPLGLSDVELSGLKGKALIDRAFPSKSEALAAVPAHCFKRDTARSMGYAARSLALSLACFAAGAALIPYKLAALPLWAAYAAVTGTVATGCWVVAHECGHGAFSDNKTLQDTVGYFLHSLLLVPYFSWQRSHAVHHARTNHMTEGETHVPPRRDGTEGRVNMAIRGFLDKTVGKGVSGALFGLLQGFLHLVVGWPAYLLWGATGGPARGATNHFWPVAPFDNARAGAELFPGRWKKLVWLSDVGVAVMGAALCAAATKFGFWPVAAVYGGPYLVVNAWLVLITWLQHTDVDIPHYDHDNWSFVKGAFHTVDRPYGKVIDWLHHRIGSTHVAHHLDATIPHYHAKEATEALAEAFPDLYLYDPTPVPEALWRVARRCSAVAKRGDKWVWVQN